MNKEGFTLAEVLAVVIILSVLALIGIFSVESIIRTGSEKAYNAQLNEIKLSAENYVKTEGLPEWCDLENDNSCYLTLRFLAFKNYIKLNEKGEFLNPKTDKSFSLEMLINIEKYGNNYVVELIAEEDMTASLLNEAQGIKNRICTLNSEMCLF